MMKSRKKFYIALGIFTVMFIAVILILKPKSHEIVVVDSLGYVVEYWEDIKDFEVTDSTVSLLGGYIFYKLNPGERVEIHDYTYTY